MGGSNNPISLRVGYSKKGSSVEAAEMISCRVIMEILQDKTRSQIIEYEFVCN